MEHKTESREKDPFISLASDSGSRSRLGFPTILLRSDVEIRRTRLSNVIAEEILPRLSNFHHGILDRQATVAAPAASEIEEFGALAMRPDAGAASIYFEKMRAKGHSLDTLFLHFLQPTARHLGELWDQDRCDFIDVTIGVAHLQEILSVFGSQEDAPVRDAHHRTLLIATPGEKHLFGLDMVAKFMRGAGWEVHFDPGSSLADCADTASREWFGVAGVTLNSDVDADAAAAVIKTVRRVSANRSIRIMVGGSAIVKEPELVLRIGADAAALDAPTAVILAKKLLLSVGGHSQNSDEAREIDCEMNGARRRIRRTGVS